MIRRLRPRLGLLGVGRIGVLRLQALVEADVADVAAIADPSDDARRAAAALAPDARFGRDLDDLLGHDLDGVVIATPSGEHAAQAIAALSAGCAVFCQKPLARTVAETRAVVAAAERADRPLAVDLCYRHVRAMAEVARLVHDGAIGDVYAAELVFHNAYGPDRAWFYDPAQSGGGCLIDLGTHLVDLALWVADRSVARVTGRIFAGGRRLALPPAVTEQFAALDIEFDDGSTADVRCSWHLPAGADAMIDCRWFGTGGGLRFANVDGSFFDFIAERFDGTRTMRLVDPPDAWGGRAVAAWVDRVSAGCGVDPAIDDLLRIADVIDRGYGRTVASAQSQASAPEYTTGVNGSERVARGPWRSDE